MDNLEKYRKRINYIDDKLLKLIEERLEIAAKIGRYKLENNKPVLDIKREQTLLKKISENSQYKFKDYNKNLWSSIMSISKAYQHSLFDEKSDLTDKIYDAIKNTPKLFPSDAVVACQGIEGAYSNLAANKLFVNPDIMFFRDFEDVFSAVKNGLCKYGILPIENSTAGSVNRVYDLMSQNKFSIIKSARLKIEHSLLANKTTCLEEINEVFSHEQAINQCRFFLKSLNVKITICENTAIAAKKVFESGRSDVAALSSPFCAELYSLKILKRSVQDNDNNYTRFICISKNIEIYPGAEKTTLMFTLPHSRGSLFNIMSIFNAHNINILKLESRPIPNTDFEFMFYFDIQCSVYSEAFLCLLNELESSVNGFNYLGSYSEIL